MTPTPETRPTRTGASTGDLLRRLVLASILYCAAGEAYCATGPVFVTDSFRWTSSGNWTAQGHVVAVELTGAQLQLLNTKTYFSMTHKHYTSITTTDPTVGEGAWGEVRLSGDQMQRLARINDVYFGQASTDLPPGTQGKSGSMSHSGRGYVADSPECYGGVLNNGPATLWSQALSWPTQCGTTPPPNQACVVQLEGGGVVDLGAVSPGTVKTAEVNGVVSCTVKGKVDLMVTNYQNTGVAEGKLLKSSVVDADGARPLPSGVRVDAGAAKNMRLKFDLQYSGAGAATTGIFVTWTPS